MTNEIQIFKNPQFGQIRVTQENGQALFCAMDVAKALGYSDTADAIARHCKSGIKVFSPHANGVGGVKTVFIPQSDIYRLIMRSQLPSAEKFQDWVCEEVLPSIQRHGAYMTPEVIEKTLTNPDFIIQLATQLKEEQQKRIAAETKIAEDAPYVDYADEVLGAKSDLDMIQVCRILADNGVVDHKGKPIGRINLFRILRLNKVLMMSNRPYQKWIDKGYFGSALHTYFTGRVNKIYNVPLVKPEGLKWLLEMFKTNQFDLNIAP